MRLAACASLCLVACSTIAAAQPAGVINGHRSEGVSALLSVFLPGGQYVYTNEPGNAVLEWVAIAAGTAGAINAAKEKSNCVGTRCDTGNEFETTFAVGLALGAWAYGIWDSDNAVHRWNDEHRLTRDRVSLSPALLRDARDRPLYGLRVAVR